MSIVEISAARGIVDRPRGKGFPVVEEPTRRRVRVKPEIIPEAVVRIAPMPTVEVPVVHEVLENLYHVGVEAPVEHAGMSLVENVRNNPYVRTVAFMGPPGSGKSTAIEQFVEALFEQANGEISVKITSFDPAFQRMVKYMPREFWESVHWKFINESLILTSKAKKKEKRSSRRIGPVREIEVIEVPFMGSKATSDRGRSFVEKKWQEALEMDNGEGMLFVPFVPAQPVTKKATSLREEISQATNVFDQIGILAKYGIDVASKMLQQTGRKAKEIIEEIVRQILHSASKKQLQLVARDIKRAFREELPTLSAAFLEEFIMLPYGVKLLPDEAYEVRRHIFYWEKTLDEMGVPSDQRYIMFNPLVSRVHRTSLRAIRA